MRTIFFSFLLVLAHISATGAQEFPNRPVRLVVPNAAGTQTDILARIMADAMAPHLGKPVVVENKPGAANVIGMEYVAKQVPADGYTFTILALPGAVTILITEKELRFDPIKDLPMLIGFTEGSTVFVASPKAPGRTLAELFDYAKKNPGKLNYGTPAAGATLTTEAMLRSAGVSVVQIPYNSAPAYYQALAAGDVHMGFVNPTVARQMTVLGVTGDKRMAAFPNAPSFAELGYPQIPGTRFTLNVPAGVPKNAFDKLRGSASAALRSPGMAEKFAKFDYIVNEQSPEQATKLAQDDLKLLSDIAKQIEFKPK